VSLEGAIAKSSIMSSLSRGYRPSGDLIPWTISQQFQDTEFGQLSGARIVRIATHPELQRVHAKILPDNKYWQTLNILVCLTDGLWWSCS
jgi:hypothetical protein